MPQVANIACLRLYPQLEIADLFINKIAGSRLNIAHNAVPVLPALALNVEYPSPRTHFGRSMERRIEIGRVVVHAAMVGIVIEEQERYEIIGGANAPIGPDLIDSDRLIIPSVIVKPESRLRVNLCRIFYPGAER